MLVLKVREINWGQIIWRMVIGLIDGAIDQLWLKRLFKMQVALVIWLAVLVVLKHTWPHWLVQQREGRVGRKLGWQ